MVRSRLSPVDARSRSTHDHGQAPFRRLREALAPAPRDLDWIFLKCLEKDRTRRYETANGLAADLRRHLNNEAVVARLPSTAYRLQKAFRRHQLVFTAGAAIAFALPLGIIGTSLQSVWATHAKQYALAARRQAELNEKKAIVAQSNEARLREQAEAARRQVHADEFVARQE